MYTLYWYPRCGTCKKAKKWLDGHDVKFELVDMIKEVPSAQQLEKWIEESQLPIRRFFNTSGQKYRALGLKNQVDGFTLKEACQLLTTDGMLIKRPILVKEDHFIAIGFKENIYEGVFKK
ncbi:MAG TPA: arsenate reductase family protein [Tetragenococcus sp.]|nr:arsenate reductase family protein [Tetragenococcus sp.]